MMLLLQFFFSLSFPTNFFSTYFEAKKMLQKGICIDELCWNFFQPRRFEIEFEVFEWFDWISLQYIYFYEILISMSFFRYYKNKQSTWLLLFLLLCFRHFQ